MQHLSFLFITWQILKSIHFKTIVAKRSGGEKARRKKKLSNHVSAYLTNRTNQMTISETNRNRINNSLKLTLTVIWCDVERNGRNDRAVPFLLCSVLRFICFGPFFFCFCLVCLNFMFVSTCCLFVFFVLLNASYYVSEVEIFFFLYCTRCGDVETQTNKQTNK